MVVAEWIGGVTDTERQRFKLVASTCRLHSLAVVIVRLLLPLSLSFSCPIFPRPSSASTLSRINPGPTFHVAPWATVYYVEGTSA